MPKLTYFHLFIEERILSGRLFQHLGVVIENVRPPSFALLYLLANMLRLAFTYNQQTKGKLIVANLYNRINWS